jgi:hypothetical protein
MLTDVHNSFYKRLCVPGQQDKKRPGKYTCVLTDNWLSCTTLQHFPITKLRKRIPHLNCYIVST